MIAIDHNNSEHQQCVSVVKLRMNSLEMQATAQAVADAHNLQCVRMAPDCAKSLKRRRFYWNYDNVKASQAATRSVDFQT